MDQHADDPDLDGDDAEPRSRLTTLVPTTLAQTAALAVVFAFLGAAVAFFLAERSDRAPSADSVDVGFLQDMLHHHQQAVVLSQLQVDDGSKGGAGVFAREILFFQSYEIGMMDRQLRQWGYAIDDRPAEAMNWMGHSVDPDAMPGMASPDELDAMQDAGDPDLVDALFFALMRDHHLGGMAMASHAAEEASDPWVRELATRMARNQRAEVAEMDSARERAGLPADPPGYEPDARVAEGGSHADHGG